MSPAASGSSALPSALQNAPQNAPLGAPTEGAAAPAAGTWLARLRGNPRLALLFAAPAVVAVIAAALLYGRAPDYGVLYTNLSDRDGGAIIGALQQMNVPYKFAAGGGALMVPQAQVPELRLKLAQQGLPKGGTVGFELMDNQKFGTSQFAEQVNYQRALEGELARSINSVGGVESSRVHLAMPKPSLFVRDQKKPSASVVLTLHRGRSLDESQVSAIVHLVSSSVPDLSPRSVTVVDQAGTLLSGSVSGGRGTDMSQLKYAREIEENYRSRIEAILQPIVGPGNVQAQVTADIDFSTVEKTDETYRPNQDGSGAVRSQQTSESSSLNGATAGGVPGALSNQPPLNPTAPLVTPPPRPGQPPAPAQPALNEAPARQTAANGRRDATINYEVDRSIRHTQQGAGGIRRLSVAVVVNYKGQPAAPAAPAGQAPNGPQALSPAELEQIQNLVKEAMGFNRERGDSLNVANSPFAREVQAPAVVLEPWRDPANLALAKTVGMYLLLGVLALFAWFAIVRPLLRKHLAPPAAPAQIAAEPALAATPAQAEPAPAADGRQAPEAGRHLENVAYAQQLAAQDPRTVAMLINHWMTNK